MKNLRELDPIGLEGCFIAGGAVLSRVTKAEVVDWDIYPKTKEAALDICLTLVDNGCFVLNITDRAITFKSNYLIADNGERQTLQVMTFDVFPTAQDIFDFFDFTVCMGAYDCDTKDYTFEESFWPDVASKTLRFNPKTKYPLASLIRLGKYRKKGYEIGKGETAKVALAVASKGLPTSWEELESQLGGVYGKSIKVLTEDEGFTIDRAYEVLSDLEFNVTYSDEGDFTWVTDEELKVILSIEPLVVYGGVQEAPNDPLATTLGSTSWVVEEGDLVPFACDDNVFDLPNTRVIEKPLSECPVKFIKAYKHLKKDSNGSYVGAVYNGNHNGVTYKPFEKTSYDKDPYLFSYVKKPKVSVNTFVSEVRIPVEDLVSQDSRKYTSKSIIVGEITGG